MAFTFNFNISLQSPEKCDGDAGDDVKDANRDVKQHVCKPDVDRSVAVGEVVKKAVEHIYTSDLLSHLENSVTETLVIGGLPPLCYVNESVFERTAAEREDGEEILTKSASQNSDLISGVYEGGLKIWECTYDLLRYLDDRDQTFALGRSVLDLGCGAGLLGILALKKGAGAVHFQDYNSTVIEQLTMPNVFLNCQEDESGEDEDQGEKDDAPPLKKKKKKRGSDAAPLSARCSFFSGDWSSFLELIQTREPKTKYQVILSSETVYNPEYYASLHGVLQQLLAEDGLVYLATKSHYFGVGGGLYLFQNFVEEKGVFQIEHVKDFDEGLQRHVVSLRFKT